MNARVPFFIYLIFFLSPHVSQTCAESIERPRERDRKSLLHNSLFGANRSCFRSRFVLNITINSRLLRFLLTQFHPWKVLLTQVSSLLTRFHPLERFFSPSPDLDSLDRTRHVPRVTQKQWKIRAPRDFMTIPQRVAFLESLRLAQFILDLQIH